MRKTGLIVLLALVVTVTSISVIGYSIIEGWGFSDSFYMTVITLSTTGFKEVKALSDAGRFFTVFIIILGVGTVGYAASTVISTLVALNLQDRGRKRMDKQLAHQRDHTIVLGFGRMGKSICKELEDSHVRFVVVEKSPDLVEDLRKGRFLWIEGDAADDENLRKAGIERAKVLVSTLDNEGDGLFAAVAAKTLNPEIFVIVRANSEASEKKMLLSGADRVVLPYVMAGRKIAQSIANPDIEDFLELTANDGSTTDRLQLIDIHVTQGSPLVSRTLRSCGFERNRLIVVGIRGRDGSLRFAPEADVAFEVGDCLIALGTRESYDQTKAEFGF